MRAWFRGWRSPKGFDLDSSVAVFHAVGIPRSDSRSRCAVPCPASSVPCVFGAAVRFSYPKQPQNAQKRTRWDISFRSATLSPPTHQPNPLRHVDLNNSGKANAASRKGEKGDLHCHETWKRRWRIIVDGFACFNFSSWKLVGVFGVFERTNLWRILIRIRRVS